MLIRDFSIRAVFDFTSRENSLQKLLAVAVDHAGDSAAFNNVCADGDDRKIIPRRRFAHVVYSELN